MTTLKTGTLDMTTARKAMIDSQLRTSGVNEPFVLNRMSSVAREDFVPADAKSIAYIDRAVPLGGGKFLPSPLFHGMVLTEAAPKADDTVLVVESGSGYLAELVGPLAANVDRITADDAATKSGRKTYSLILVDGAIAQLPAGLAKRLADGGKIVTGLADGGVTRLASGLKVARDVVLAPFADIGIPLLHAFDKAKEWSF